MHLKESEAGPEVRYYFRSAAEGPERGPFDEEALRDLAEFQHVTPQSWIRIEGESEWRRLQEWPALLAALFPEKKTFGFKRYERTDDPDAGLAAVEVHSLFRCDPGQSPVTAETAREEGDKPPIAEPGGNEPGMDTRELLAETAHALRACRGEAGAGRFVELFPELHWTLLLRWGVALFLVGLGFWLWGLVHTGANIFLVLLLGLVPIALAIALTASSIIDFSLGLFERILVREPPPQVDFTEAEARFAARDWAGATAAYRKIVKQDPHQLRPYRAAIEAAVAAGDEEQAAAFQASAAKHLSPADRNLLTEALRRHGLPPLPATEPPGGRWRRRRPADRRQ